MLSRFKLNKLYEKGKSSQEISKLFGFSVGKVNYWLNKYNIKKYNNVITIKFLWLSKNELALIFKSVTFFIGIATISLDPHGLFFKILSKQKSLFIIIYSP